MPESPINPLADLYGGKGVIKYGLKYGKMSKTKILKLLGNVLKKKKSKGVIKGKDVNTGGYQSSGVVKKMQDDLKKKRN